MPSPFPGMDPYLEHPAYFPGLHDWFVAFLGGALQERLPPPYFADIARRAWIEVSNRPVVPDVQILRSRRDPGPELAEQGGVAVAAVARSRAVVVTVAREEVRQTFLEIRIRQGADERVVTTIEVLSPANKTPGDHGRDPYLQKQREILDSQTHLVEIDLLRGGMHATAVPLELAFEKAGPFDYHVSIHRFDRSEDFLVYPIRLEERLPEVAIPLLPGDPDVTIDLQAVFDRCYDNGPYRRRVRYAEDAPVPPLRPEQAEWAARFLRPTGEARP